MKKLLTLSLFSTLLFFGCDQSSNISSPADTDNHSYQLIKLPPKKGGLSVETVFFVTETIDGDKGGEIKLKQKYETVNGRKVKIEAKLKIKKNSFPGVLDITLMIDDQFAVTSISPAMEYAIPLELDVKFEGLDLENMNLTTGDYEFVFFDVDGSIEEVSHKKIQVNENKGKLSVKKALINQWGSLQSEVSLPFSRYGFVN